MAEPLPATSPPPAPATPGLDQLRLLAIGHYVLAGITALFALFPVIHLVIGLGMLFGLLDAGQAADRLFGLLFIAIALVMITLGLALAAALASIVLFLVLGLVAFLSLGSITAIMNGQIDMGRMVEWQGEAQGR